MHWDTIWSGFVTFIASNLVQIALVVLIGYACKKGSKIGDFIISSQTAQKMILIADDITHEILATEPTLTLAQFLAKAVDKIIAVTGISKETATRIATAAFVRVNVNGNMKALTDVARNNVAK